jgi:2-polyprenyl-6-methoxyphenol hydroxylase-like FAD-dependent oxidoreductase
MANTPPLPEQLDAIVCGGGPGGSTCATVLARKGLRVALFEREKFPRFHVGESLLPFCYKLFEDLGVVGQMSKMFVRKPGVRSISGEMNGLAKALWR